MPVPSATSLLSPLPVLRASLQLVLGIGGSLLIATPGQAAELKKNGVACDDRQQICYTFEGPSVDQTKKYYGKTAEKDLMRQLSGRPAQRDFQLSSGEVCDLRAQTCWDDGWRRKNVSNQLTKHLFGYGGSHNSGSNYGNGGSGRWDRHCEMSQRGRRVFNGECNLSIQEGMGNRAYVVETREGRTYNFYYRNGQLMIRDATGSWPAVARDRGNSVLFRWADVELEANRRGGGGWSSNRNGNSNNGGGGLSNDALQTVIEGLFR
jgi:hypothetical protein